MTDNIPAVAAVTLPILLTGVILLGWVSRAEKQARQAGSTEDNQGYIRRTAAAGSFYPGEATELNSRLDLMLNETAKPATGSPVRIMVVPHAGLKYSGPTAAAGYGQTSKQKVERVIILGASHTSTFSQAAVIRSGKWETPNGSATIDTDLADRIISPPLLIIENNQVHEGDHNLEMQVIWVRKLWPEARIVPVMVSATERETAAALALKIAQNFDDRTLLIVSSDLAHYPDYATANRTDEKTVKAILTGSRAEFETYLQNAKATTGTGVETLACGQEAIKIGMETAELLNLESPQLAAYSNSGETTGDKSRVVGYAAILFKGKLNGITIPRADNQTRAEARRIAEQAVADLVSGRPATEIRNHNPYLSLPLGAFVTLRKNGELRGCIGEFEPDKPLYRVIADKARDAAGRDTRFAPVREDELPEIEVEISVMTPKRRVNNWKEIRLGIDGVVITNRGRSGTFLPQVAQETSWQPEKFMEELCTQKAGLDKNCYLDPKTEIYIFQTEEMRAIP